MNMHYFEHEKKCYEPGDVNLFYYKVSLCDLEFVTEK